MSFGQMSTVTHIYIRFKYTHSWNKNLYLSSRAIVSHVLSELN